MLASAQYVKSIRLSADDGTSVLFSLSRSLTIRFENENLTATDNEQTISISLDKVKFEYSTEEGTSNIDASKNQTHYMTENAIVFQRLPTGENVRVYSLDGKLLLALPNNGQEESIRLGFSTLPKGICIIQAGNYSLKYKRD